MSPSAIKAAEQSLLSPVSIVCHGLTSGIRKLPDVLTLQLLAPAGILTATICMGERLWESSSPSPFTDAPPSTDSYYPMASDPCWLCPHPLTTAPCKGALSFGFQPSAGSISAEPLHWVEDQPPPSAPVLHVVYNTLQEGIFSRY